MNPAVVKFLEIFAGIILYEVQHSNDGYLLSQQCDTWVEAHPVLARLVISAIGSVLVLHLANFLPVEYDLLHKGLWTGVLYHMRGIHDRLVAG